MRSGASYSVRGGFESESEESSNYKQSREKKTVEKFFQF